MQIVVLINLIRWAHSCNVMKYYSNAGIFGSVGIELYYKYCIYHICIYIKVMQSNWIKLYNLYLSCSHTVNTYVHTYMYMHMYTSILSGTKCSVTHRNSGTQNRELYILQHLRYALSSIFRHSHRSYVISCVVLVKRWILIFNSCDHTNVMPI